MRQPSGDFHTLVGIARADITPPIGIYSRLWGAATHETATGVHRPLLATALAFASSSRRQVIVSLDICEWQDTVDEQFVRERICADSGLAEDELLLQASHTHSAPSPCSALSARPGGALIPEFIELIASSSSRAVSEALEGMVDGVLSWAYGRSSVATNRDLLHNGRYLIGWNPDEPADDTLLVGRITDEAGVPVAVIVNYACHPTALGWGNSLISPDFVGALRHTVEEALPGATCIFLQGASGELAPAEQYSAVPEVADRIGRSIGRSAVATLETMAPPDHRLSLAGTVESGASLAVWRNTPVSPTFALDSRSIPIALPRNLRTLTEQTLASLPPSVREERKTRAALVSRNAGNNPTIDYTVWIWKLGGAIVVAHPGEAYSWLQRELRERLAPTPVVVMNLTNGAGAFYLPPSDAYATDRYAVWQTPAGAGSLELMAQAVLSAVLHSDQHPYQQKDE